MSAAAKSLDVDRFSALAARYRALTEERRAIQWELADLLAAAGDHDRTYPDASRQLDVPPAQLHTWAWVARKVPPRVRCPGLSFGHHSAVAALSPDDQRGMLARAERGGWTVRELRAAVHADEGGGEEFPEVSLPGECAHARLRCAECGEEVAS